MFPMAETVYHERGKSGGLTPLDPGAAPELVPGVSPKRLNPRDEMKRCKDEEM